MVSYVYILVLVQLFHIYFAVVILLWLFFYSSGSYYTVFSHYEVRSQHAVPVVRQWLHRHQTGVKELSGSGQAIIRQWLGNQLGSQCTIVDSVSDI